MDSTSLFWISFSLTFGLLLATLWAGWRGARKLHLRLAPVALLSLTGTVLITEWLAKARVFPEGEMAVHLVFAKSAGVLALVTAGSGVYLWRTGRGRRLHRWVVALFLLATLVATGTGIWVFSLSTPA